MRYGIDRDRLKFLGVSDIMIDRLYRALFVYSVGFYELITKITKFNNKEQSESKRTKIISSVWTVYSILLEFWWKSDYRLLISQLASEYEKQKQTLKDIIEKNNDMFLDKEAELRDQFKDMQKDYEELQQARVYYK